MMQKSEEEKDLHEESSNTLSNINICEIFKIELKRKMRRGMKRRR